MKRTEPFDFYQPTTLTEASRLLKDNGPGGRFLAGGTDLVIAMKEKGLLPKYIVDLKRVPGLAGIREHDDGTMTIGALTTMYAIETSPVIKKKYPFLAQSAAEVGSIQIRNRAGEHLLEIGAVWSARTRPNDRVGPPHLADRNGASKSPSSSPSKHWRYRCPIPTPFWCNFPMR